MSNYIIEKNIPMPGSRNTRLAKYPLGEMEIGDSFTVKGNEKHTVRAATQAYGKRSGKKFQTRSVDDNTTRVWRIE